MAEYDPSANQDTERFLKRFNTAKGKRERIQTLLDDAYEYALPLRHRSNADPADKPNMDRVFDSTSGIALQDYASERLDDVWPADSKPFELKAGKEVPDAEREEGNRLLAAVAEEITDSVNNSNFSSAAHEALLDQGIGTGILMAEPGDEQDPVKFEARPLNDCIPDTGPFNTLDAFFFPRTVKAGELQIVWPKAVLDDDLARDARENPDKPVKVIEGVQRDWSVRGTETHKYRCVVEASKHVLVEGVYSGQGSSPVIDFSYTRVAGQVMGLGPSLLALPDTKSLNLVKQLILENADIRISGIWQAEDDGVVNPNTIQIVPGTVIPKAAGSKGLESVLPAGDTGLAQFITQDLQNSIRRVHNGDDLGPRTGTPMSAQEVIQRTVNRAKRQAGPNNRVTVELLFKLVRRVAYIRKEQGKIKLPVIDGRKVVLRPMGPISRSQALDEILRNDRYVEMMNMRFGPQMTALLLDSEEYGAWLADKMGVAPKLLRKKVDRDDLKKSIAAMAAQAAQAGAVQ